MCKDEEEKFEESLKCVEKAISGLKCKKKIQLCTSWVRRLQYSDPDEYEIRNRYLYLLWKQLDEGHLEAPFLTCPPCYGKLPPLEKQVTKCCESARSSGRKCFCCKIHKCQGKGCINDTCHAKKKSRSVPDIPQNLEIPEIRIINATVSNDSALNIPTPTSTSRETSVGMSKETSRSQGTPHYLETPNHQEPPNYQEERIYQETPKYQEAPNYREERIYQETPKYQEALNYQEERIYQETPKYQEAPNYQEARIYQETPNPLTTSQQLYKVSQDAESPYTMSEEEPEEATCKMTKEALRGMLQEVPVGLSQCCTPCPENCATPGGYEGSTMRVQTKGRSVPPQFGPQFRDCQTDMRNFYNLMGGSGNRNARPKSPSCSPSTPNPMPDARRRLDMSRGKCDSQNSQYLMIGGETPQSATPQESARNPPSTNSSVNQKCLQPKLMDNAFKRKLAEMNYIYNLRMKTLDEKVRVADCVNNTLKSQVGQMKVKLATQNRADEQTIRCLREENRTLKAKIQKSSGSGAGIRQVGQSIDQLECRLNKSINCNYELQNSLKDLEEKIKLMQQTKAEEVCQFQTRQAKDIERIRTMTKVKMITIAKDYQSKLQSMEESYKEQLRSYEAEHRCNIQRLISENEATFKEFKDSTNQLMAEKDAEIERLHTTMEEECSKLEADVQGLQSRAGELCDRPDCVACREKVCVLEERLHRADNIKKKCLRYFQGKLFEMLKEKHKHENTVKMLLMKQRAEITLQVFNESQLEMKEAVSRWQECCKKIISCMQNQISSNKVEVDDIMGIQLGCVGSARKKCLRNPNPGCDDKTDQT